MICCIDLTKGMFTTLNDCYVSNIFYLNVVVIIVGLTLSKNVKLFLHDKFVMEWKLQIFECINYRIYKTDCDSYKLPIEAGRFFGIIRSERICELCDKEELGDEFHYIISCNFFRPERHRFIPVPIYNNINILSLTDIMNSQDKYVLVGLAKFCKIVMSVFK